jgi:ATP-dependent RNA helicase SUPV3L1/SUV3
VEDKLSDALHERLTDRFIDRRTSVLMRRLRENAQLEPKMSKTGEVVVEGHAIGRLDGFVFVADAPSGGSEAKALQSAAQKALAGEIATRATRLSEAPDGQFVLAADGTIRWTGAAVGKLIAGEEALRPRVRVVADEHLSGAPREAVEARLDAWAKSHIEKLLGPLFELSAASDIAGIARGVAFQLIEALGVLDRQRVADEVKDLEQPERASLRKYGVRFGAYHIYLPPLLKPAPRAVGAQLWALAHDGPQSKGLDDLLHLAADGRTSIPVNREVDTNLYRAAGYRLCGERAVRVDILERLADLIRPALAWREGAFGQKPPGAIAGGGFTVVNTMTSLTGASGQDFASILRSLGYRLELRPKPLEPVAPAPDNDAVAARDPATAAFPPREAGSTPDEIPAEVVSIAPLDAPAVKDVAAEDEGSATEDPGREARVIDPFPAVVPRDAIEQTGERTLIAAVEPQMIEVWRPGRSEGRRRPQGKHRHGGRPFAKRADTPQQDAIVASNAPEAAAPVPSDEQALSVEQIAAPEPIAAEPSKPERHSRHRLRHGADQRFDRPRRERERPPAHVIRHDRHERHERREKTPDPNSPFAQLAALKAQLEAEAKERR